MSYPDLSRAIVIVDFGGQYAHLIASRIRRFGYRAFIVTTDIAPAALKNAAGIIFSGGPQSVYEQGSPQADPGILDLDIPVLGLCYGHQWLAHVLGGTVGPAAVKEYGPTDIRVTEPACPLFHGLPRASRVWMSHGDEVQRLPPGFVPVASSKDCAHAAMMHPERQLYGIQFHIEVTHSQHGMDILRRFVDLCRPAPWSISGYYERVSEDILRETGDRKVFMLVSGGVDSTVAFTLLNRVLGPERVQGLLIDTGLMRQGEVQEILQAFEPLGIRNLQVEDASELFYRALQGVYEPEEKRAVIGATFLDVQRAVSERMGLRIEDGWMLGQGTIYPDTIETGGTTHAATIKTHHNRVPLVQRMIEQGLVIEPLKELYKDEVRQLGEELSLPHDVVWRHPFPGPGLGVRILCALEPFEFRSPPQVTDLPHVILPVKSVGVQGDGRTYRHALAFFPPDGVPTDAHMEAATTIPNASKAFSRVLACLSHTVPFQPVFTPTVLTRATADLLREADAIVTRHIRAAGLLEQIWQMPVVLLPIGAALSQRSIVLRPIESTDAMTAAAFRVPGSVLRAITHDLLAVDGIDAVFLDLTNKPPATIEWE